MKNNLAFFNGRALFCGIGISFLLNLTGTSFWISYIIGTLLGILILALVKKCNNYKFTKILSGFTLCVLCTSLLVNMGHSLYLDDTPVFILTLFAAVGAFIISRCESLPFSRMLHILFIYSMFLFICKNLSLYPHMEFDNMFPQGTVSVSKIIYGSISFALISTVPILSLNDMQDKKNVIVNYIISMITITSVTFLIVCVMGIKEASIYRYPEYIVLKRIELLEFLSNVDNILNFVIVCDLIVTMAAGFKNMEISGKYVKFLSPILVIIVSTVICFENWPLLYLYNYLPILLFFLFILILIPKK